MKSALCVHQWQKRLLDTNIQTLLCPSSNTASWHFCGPPYSFTTLTVSTCRVSMASTMSRSTSCADLSSCKHDASFLRSLDAEEELASASLSAVLVIKVWCFPSVSCTQYVEMTQGDWSDMKQTLFSSCCERKCPYCIFSLKCNRFARHFLSPLLTRYVIDANKTTWRYLSVNFSFP